MIIEASEARRGNPPKERRRRDKRLLRASIGKDKVWRENHGGYVRVAKLDMTHELDTIRHEISRLWVEA